MLDHLALSIGMFPATTQKRPSIVRLGNKIASALGPLAADQDRLATAAIPKLEREP